MAFFDPQVGSPHTTSLPAPVPHRLDRRERDVLLLARADRLSSLRKPNRLSDALARCFGLEAPNRLADPRLEALRRFAVLLRYRGDRLDPREESTLRNTGYSAGQVSHARALVLGAIPSRRPRIDIRAAVVAVLLAPACWGYQRLTEWTADPLIGLVLTLVGLSSLAPLAVTPVPPRRQSAAG